MTTLTYRQVRDEYQQIASQHIQLTTSSRTTHLEVILDVLGAAAVSQKSLDGACKNLRHAPTSPAVLYQLRQGWLAGCSLEELEEQLNGMLVAQLPDYIRGNEHQVAIDLTFIPYHGQVHQDEKEVRRSRAKSGTTHFHVYASAYIIKKNKRVTVAVAYFQAGESLLILLKSLLKRLKELDIGLKRLLIDRQFASVQIIRYLEQQPWQSIMPVPARGKTLKQIKSSAKRSCQRQYTMTSSEDGSVNFTLHVVCKYARGRRGKHGIDRLLFAVLGQPWRSSSFALAETYDRRFGVETSYRQMNSVRIRTSSRDPKLRLLFVMLAFFLLNLWVYLNWAILAIPRRGGRWLDQSLFRLKCFCNFLDHAIGEKRKFVLSVSQPSDVF